MGTRPISLESKARSQQQGSLIPRVSQSKKQVLPPKRTHHRSLASSTQESSVSPNGSRARSSKERREEMGLEFLNSLSAEEIERLVTSKIASCLSANLTLLIRPEGVVSLASAVKQGEQQEAVER